MILTVYLVLVIISYYGTRYITKSIYKSWDWSDIIRILALSFIAPIISTIIWLILNFEDLNIKMKPPKWL